MRSSGGDSSMHHLSTTLDLQEHFHDLNRILATWAAKQDQLLQKLSSQVSSFDGVDPVSEPTLHAVAPMIMSNPGRSDVPQSKNSFRAMGSLALTQDFMSVTPSKFEPAIYPKSSMEAQFNGNECRKSRRSRKSRRQIREEIEGDPFRRLLRHRLFAYSTGIVICFNSLIMALAADYAMSNPAAPNSSVALGACETACALYYIFEVALKIYVERSEFWRGFEWNWNIFDLCLALQALVEQLERFIVKDMNSPTNLSFVRVLRLMKLLKLFRVIRLMLVFRELRLLLGSLYVCLKAFAWSCVLMISLCYMFAICMMQFCSYYASDMNGEVDDLETASGIEKYWSSTLTAMNSLFLATTNGKDWEELSLPMSKIGALPYAIFAIFIALFNFVILNIVNSIFIETMMNHAQRDNQMIIATMLEKSEEFAEKLRDLFEIMEDDGDGEISYGEFCKHIESKELRAFITSMEIDIVDVKNFFRVLSDGGKRPVNFDAFIDGCIKVRGMARSIDLMDLIYQHKHVASDQRRFFHYMRQEMSKVASLVSAIAFEGRDQCRNSDQTLLAMLRGSGKMSL